MASESRDDAGVSVDLPAEVAEWLDEEAAALGVERSRFLAELLAAHRDAADDDGITEALDEVVADAADDAVAERLDDSLSDAVDESDLAALRSSFQDKIEDVRERVIQVKREADAKAPADHDHAEFAAVADLEEDLAAVEGELEDLRRTLTGRVDDQAGDLDEFENRLGDVEDKLRRVAWVVSDLKEETSGRDAHERAVERIKRAAAQEGVSTADCERCGESVHVALLTDPECPHCQATVADVRPDGGFFRTKARLVPAAQLESGEPEDGED